MSGQPCGYVLEPADEYGEAILCGFGPVMHGGGIGHPYTPLERRTGKDRRGGQVAAHRLLMPPHPGEVYAASALCSCGEWQYDAGSFRVLTNEYRTVLADHATHARLAAAPQAAPADGALREAHSVSPASHPVCRCDVCARERDARFELGKRSALAGADAAPERTLPSARSLVCSIGEHAKCDGNAPNGPAGIGYPCSCRCHAALRAEAKE